VMLGEMPPWPIVSGYGEFADENRLKAAEADKLIRWGREGAPPGDLRAAPPGPPPPNDWPFGPPDLLLKPSRPFDVDAEGPGFMRSFVLDPMQRKPIMVSAIDVRPGIPQAIRWAAVRIDRHGRGRKLQGARFDGKPGYRGFGDAGLDPGDILLVWSPASKPHFLPLGSGYRIEPGDQIALQVWYRPTGKPEKDLTSVGLYLCRSQPFSEAAVGLLRNRALDIPARAARFLSEATQAVDGSCTIVSVTPRMRFLGHSIRASVQTPNGLMERIVYVNDWDYGWQRTYWLKTPIHVPKGSVFHVQAVYDNSSANLANPNLPPKDVLSGNDLASEELTLVYTFVPDRR